MRTEAHVCYLREGRSVPASSGRVEPLGQLFSMAARLLTHRDTSASVLSPSRSTTVPPRVMRWECSASAYCVCAPVP